MSLKFPNYLDSLSIDECLEILKKNGLELDLAIKDDPTSPSFEIKKIEKDVWVRVRDLLGGSGDYNPKTKKGMIVNFGRYFSPIQTLKEMMENRKKFLSTKT